MTPSRDHVVAGLTEKRRELAGIIDELQRQLDQHRADLTHIDRVHSVSSPPISTLRRSDRSAPIAAIAISRGTSYRGSALECSERQRASSLSTADQRRAPGGAQELALVPNLGSLPTPLAREKRIRRGQLGSRFADTVRIIIG